MNKRLLIVATTVFISIGCFSQSKDTSVRKLLVWKFTLPEISYHLNNLAQISNYLNKTNLPHQDIIQMEEAVDSLRRSIIEAIKPQLANKK
jgi:hypothetical protein